MVEPEGDSGQLKSVGSSTEQLEQLGIEEGRWYETIVTTNGSHINAAAIGIRRVGEKLNMKIYELSNTFENFQKAKERGEDTRFAINIIDTSQLDLLCWAALKGWGSPIPEFPKDDFDTVSEAPIMKDAHVSIICQPEEQEIETFKDSYGKSTRLKLTAKVIEIIVNDEDDFTPISRSPEEPLIEALVYATKFKIAKGAMKDKCRGRVEELLEQAGRPNDVAHTLTMEALKEYFGIFD
jgi:hypothetical protein